MGSGLARRLGWNGLSHLGDYSAAMFGRHSSPCPACGEQGVFDGFPSTYKLVESIQVIATTVRSR